VTAVRAELTRLSERYRELPTIGRTHGQHAIPLTMGFKFANYLYEMSVAESFLERVKVSTQTGPSSGRLCGTMRASAEGAT